MSLKIKQIVRISLSAATFYFPLTSWATAGDFARDRNIPVAERLPQDYQPLRIGAFAVEPKLLAGLTLTDNVYFTQLNQKNDTILTFNPSVSAVSQWNRHQVKASAEINYDAFSSNSNESTLTGNILAAGRYDLLQSSNVFGSLAFGNKYEPRYDPSTPSDAAKPVEYTFVQPSLGAVYEGNRMKLQIRADYNELNYSNVKSTNGGEINQDRRDYHRTATNGRAEYAVSPDTSVYLTYETNTIGYRLKTNNRDSHGYFYGVGTSFEFTNLITGTLEIGQMKQTFKNVLFKPVPKPYVRSKINYFPTDRTTVKFVADRTIQETPDLNASSYTSTTNSLGVDQQITSLWIASATYAHNISSFNGTDRRDSRDSVTLSAGYSVRKNISLNANYSYRSLSSRGVNAITPYKENRFGASLTYHY